MYFGNIMRKSYIAEPLQKSNIQTKEKHGTFI